METACLRIKFTPLLQNLQKHSNQCLEIVPEITYIQNLDKIKWKEEENCIQYTVPITYKIIIRKKEIKYNEDLNRTYYSCVDLSFLSSDVNLMKIESATIRRTLSDTFILYDITTQKDNIIISSTEEKKEDDIIIEKDIEKIAEINNDTCVAEIPDGSRCTLNSSVKQKSVTITMDQITNTDFSLENQIKSDCKNLDSSLQTCDIRNKSDAKRNLCLTPICSVNTDDNSGDTKNYTQLLLYEAIDFLRDINVFNRSNNNVYPTIKNDYLLYDIFNMTTLTTENYKPLQYIQSFDSNSSHRILPEVRVAKIVQQMEKEINPLKVMLNEIISKCSSLGLTKKNYQQSKFANEINVGKEIHKCSNILNNAKSNRVVYSVVFDG